MMKTRDFQGLKIRLDRPKGFVQKGKDAEGKPWERTYLFDYGYIPRTKGGDGDGLDVFLGPNPAATESFWALQRKEDGDFDEYKVFLGFPNKAAAKKAYLAHIPKKFLSGMVSMPVEMMKAMLGIEPVEKLASYVSFLDELEKIGSAYAHGE